VNRASSATGWVRNPDGTMGYTWNPITGCLNGCEYCYARRLANGRLRSRYLANSLVAFADGIRGEEHKARNDPFYPRFWPEKLSQPLATMRATKNGYVYYAGKAKGIFVCDMSDLFGIGIPEQWQAQIFQVFADCPDHRFYLLTKQPQNLIKFSPFPDNCRVGVTATDCEFFANAIFYLNRIKATVKYVSFEPLLGRLGISNLEYAFTKAGISWVIIGAQTKPYKPPKIEWVQEIVGACDKVGIPVFLKDNLYPLITGTPLGQCTGLWAEGFKLRQEMPNV